MAFDLPPSGDIEARLTILEDHVAQGHFGEFVKGIVGFAREFAQREERSAIMVISGEYRELEKKLKLNRSFETKFATERGALVQHAQRLLWDITENPKEVER